jgi:uncharacterized alkaline shock family protein YloU
MTETMTETYGSIGKTTIAPEVLLSIARLTTLGTPGVSHLGSTTGNVSRFLKRDPNHGVAIAVENNIVYADIHVVLQNDVEIREVCRNIQKQITRAISDMVGMEVGQINIHVDDINYGPNKDTV